MMVTHHEKYVVNEAALGYQERLAHVDTIRSGAPCYMIMCVVKDPDASPRKIQSFDKDRIFVGGRIVERDGDTFIEVKETRPVSVMTQRDAV